GAALQLYKGFRFVGYLEKRLSVMERHHLIIPAVGHKYGYPDLTDILCCAIDIFDKHSHRQPGIQARSQISRRSKGGFDDQRRWILSFGQPGSNRSAQRTPHYHNLISIEAPALAQITPGSGSIAVGALFRGTALALTVAAVVKDKHI